MNASRLLAATAALALCAGAAHAQAPAAAAPGLTPPTAAPIPGICIFSADAVIAASNVGKSFQTRMQQLAAQADAELTPERTGLESDAKALQAQQASLAPDVFQQRAAVLNQRINAFQAKADQRSQELEATQQKNAQRILVEIQPVLVTTYNARRCAAVLDSQGLIAANPAMDISADVATALNGRISTITFDRERLDQQPGAAAAAPRAAAPAAAAPRAATPAPRR